MSKRSAIAAAVIAGEQAEKREAFFPEDVEREVVEREVDAMLSDVNGQDIDAEIDAILNAAAPQNGTEKAAAQADVDMWNRTLFYVRLQDAGVAVMGSQRQGQSVDEIKKTIDAYTELYGVHPLPLTEPQRAGLVNQVTSEYTEHWAALDRQAKVQKYNGNTAALAKTEEAQGKVRDALRAVIQASRAC